MVAFALFVGFVVGALAVIGVEVVGVLFFIQKLGRKTKEDAVKVAKSGSSEREEPQFSFPDKHGWVWILEKEKIPKTLPSFDKGSRSQKRKNEIVEVSPVRKHASIKDLSLILTEPDGNLTKIPLSGCTVEAVSATNLPTRKWAKKYPVRVENKSSVLYHGSKLFYLYFETSSEKESWCKALRLASCDDKEKLKWFHKSLSDFHNYLGSLNVEYPSFLKPSIGFNPETGDKTIKIDTSSSKVRHFLKKLAKKTSKAGREDKKEKSNTVHESSSVGGSSRHFQTQKKPNHATEEEIVQALLTPRSDTDSTHSINKIASDDGTLCCNLLISRLFFDAKSNVDLKNSIQARIQRTLSTIRTPSYIGEIICTGVNPGNIPPYIHGMRVLPSDLKEVVAMEIDIEYYGGAVLDIETRLEVQELENPETMNSDSKSVNDVTSDLLEGVGYYEKQLKLNEHKGDEIRKLEEMKSFKGDEQASSSSTVSKWKSVLNSVAKQVSQLPLSMAIRVTTLRGTVRVHIKPPPSDQLWFGFTSMPDIDFSLESSVGDHKITSGHIALFVIGKFKTAIRETMVLPNSESVTIPFMLAEKNDWVPQKVAPFIWANPDPTTNSTTTTTTTTNTTTTTTTTTTTSTEPTIVHEPHPCQPSQEPPHPQEPQDVHNTSNRSLESVSETDDQNLGANEDPVSVDEKTPLLESEEQGQEADLTVSLRSVDEKREVKLPNWQLYPLPPQPVVVTSEESNDMAEGEDARLRRMGTKAKMLGLRKKMGEKLEEKRRNIEEKGRHIVEKMRGPGPGGS